MNSEFYLSDPSAVDEALSVTGLSIDELEFIVGRFKKDHHRWPNQLKGKVVFMKRGGVQIKHHFTNKKLWELDRIERIENNHLDFFDHEE